MNGKRKKGETMSLVLKSEALGELGANCYLVFDEATKEALVIDPGEYNEELESMLEDNEIKELKYVLLTHGHFDHILGAEKLLKNYGGKLAIGKEDEICLTDNRFSLISYFGGSKPDLKADILLTGGDELDFAGRKIKVLHTPGHTKGGVCYLLEKMLFTGDTLFKNSIGRFDFPGGDFETIISSVRKLVKLDSSLIVLPGHGEKSTIEKEKNGNPYCR